MNILLLLQDCNQREGLAVAPLNVRHDVGFARRDHTKVTCRAALGLSCVYPFGMSFSADNDYTLGVAASLSRQTWQFVERLALRC